MAAYNPDQIESLWERLALRAAAAESMREALP
jgi:hypothetical protein